MSQPDSLHGRLLRYSKRICIAVALFLGVVYGFIGLGLPKLIQWQLPEQIKKSSGHVLTCETPAINPFKLTLSVSNCALSTPQGEQLVAFEHLSVNCGK